MVGFLPVDPLTYQKAKHDREEAQKAKEIESGEQPATNWFVEWNW